jgi:hypothetical protein
MLQQLPNRVEPSTLKDEPSGTNMRTENVSPATKLSSTERHDPSFAIPYTEMDEPSRKKLLTLKLELKLIKSSTLSDSPRRAQLKMLQLLPALK